MSDWDDAITKDTDERHERHERLRQLRRETEEKMLFAATPAKALAVVKSFEEAE